MEDKSRLRDVLKSRQRKASDYSGFLIAYLKDSGFLNLFVQTVFNTILIIIGIIAPAFWLTALLHRVGFLSFEPKLNYFLYISLGCLPIGALLVLLGIRDGGKRFLHIMVYLFLYGVILPFLLSAVSIIVAGSVFHYFLDKPTIRFITTALALLLTVISIIYGIYSFINDGGMEGSNVQSSYNLDGLELITVIDELSESSSDSSDGGSDGGGDGGD